MPTRRPLSGRGPGRAGAIIAAAFAIGATGCGGGGSHDHNPTAAAANPMATLGRVDTSHPANDYCKRLIAAGGKIAAAQNALYGTAGAAGSSAPPSSSPTAAVDALVTELQGLQSGAPADIQAALADMVSGYRSAGALLQNPTTENKQQLSALNTKLSSDSQTISSYVSGKCSSG